MQNPAFHSLVRRAREGDVEALDQLLVELQAELKRIVRATRRNRAGLSMRSTEIFNEAFLKLFSRSFPGFTDEQHLLAMWANASSWVVIEAWRRKGRRPELDQLVEETVSGALEPGSNSPDAVAEAFEALKSAMPREGLAAELRLLSGLSTCEVAMLMDCSEQSARRWVQSAAAWIRVFIETSSGVSTEGVAGGAHVEPQ